ncbi:CDPK-related kinase 3 [Actinidia rufa]|uniref:CDPK-related kinase 3 n=1 Tax=Actinidia rufa TaxID=165716 RepID=A0A7J0EC41_9ERIC|nr:CDPK-related kinase 3 [Actinidia rufa]
MGHCCSKDVSVSVAKEDTTVPVPAGGAYAANHRPKSSRTAPPQNGTTPDSLVLGESMAEPVPRWRGAVAGEDSEEDVQVARSPRRGRYRRTTAEKVREGSTRASATRRTSRRSTNWGRRLGEGIFGHTCWAKGKKGELKNQPVAVKIISKAKMTTAISIEDVRREVKILKALSRHNNLVKFHDAFEDAQNVYVVMEGGRYTEEDAKPIVIQILSVVAFCHLQGVVHRDLKPENFLFTTRDEDAPMKVIDFGLSDFIRPDQRLNDIVGSAYYVAPEVLHRSYSLEADMWRLIQIFDDSPWPGVSAEAKDFVRRLLNKDHRKRMTAAQALTHQWLRDENHAVPLDILIYKLVKSYVRATPLKRAAFKALMKNETDAMKESRVPDILNLMEPLSYRKMDFEEFCAAAISTYQLEALEGWENIASTAFKYFEQEGNRAISVEELAKEMNLGPTAHSLLKDWIRISDGKLSFLGYTKFLHGVTIRSSNTRYQ